MTKTTSLFALTGIALASGLMASEPLNPEGLRLDPADKPVAKPLVERVAKPEIKPHVDVCRMPAPISLLKQLKDMEANDEAIQSVLGNEKAKTTIDKLKAPIVLKSMEDALKHLTRASMEKINVDFEKQQVVIFAWQGSGQDRLNGHLARSKDAAATFYYNPGRTEDLRTHSTIYSMPKGTKLNVQEQRIIRCGVGLQKIEPQVLPNGQKLELKIEPQQLQGGIELRVQPLQKAE